MERLIQKSFKYHILNTKMLELTSQDKLKVYMILQQIQADIISRANIVHHLILILLKDLLLLISISKLLLKGIIMTVMEFNIHPIFLYQKDMHKKNNFISKTMIM